MFLFVFLSRPYISLWCAYNVVCCCIDATIQWIASHFYFGAFFSSHKILPINSNKLFFISFVIFYDYDVIGCSIQRGDTVNIMQCNFLWGRVFFCSILCCCYCCYCYLAECCGCYSCYFCIGCVFLVMRRIFSVSIPFTHIYHMK